ncbi:hypothetical protein BC833DRAFT_604917, partial [Globomyces pollinis-pini]
MKSIVIVLICLSHIWGLIISLADDSVKITKRHQNRHHKQHQPVRSGSFSKATERDRELLKELSKELARPTGKNRISKPKPPSPDPKPDVPKPETPKDPSKPENSPNPKPIPPMEDSDEGRTVPDKPSKDIPFPFPDIFPTISSNKHQTGDKPKDKHYQSDVEDEDDEEYQYKVMHFDADGHVEKLNDDDELNSDFDGILDMQYYND